MIVETIPNKPFKEGDLFCDYDTPSLIWIVLEVVSTDWSKEESVVRWGVLHGEQPVSHDIMAPHSKSVSPLPWKNFRILGNVEHVYKAILIVQEEKSQKYAALYGRNHTAI